jgi:hypothetical protein
MAEEHSIPEKLFEYRRFDVTALNMIRDHGLGRHARVGGISSPLSGGAKLWEPK